MIIKATELKPEELKEAVKQVESIYDKTHAGEEAGLTTIGWIRGVYPTRETAEEAISRDDLFIMKDDTGRVVASAVINQAEVPEYADCTWEYEALPEEIMVLHTLTVDPDEKGKGYGKAFVAFYERYAADNGCHFLRMDTNERNTAARKMYAGLGYNEPGIVDCVFNGIPKVKLVCLEKKLD